jgi:nucleotide-binding universal stress UspA family protein
MNLQNILFATDFSSCSEAALQCATAVATRFQAKLFVAHIISETLFADVPAEVQTEARTRTIADAKKKLEEIGSRLQAEIILEEGPVADVLLALAEFRSIDLLVVGTQGHGRLQRLLLGSVAEKLSRQAPCPVLVVPEASMNRKSGVSTILCPTNFSERSAAALKQAWQLAKTLSAQIILLHVMAPALSRADRISERTIVEEPLSRLSSFLSAGDRSRAAELAVEFGSPADTIVRVARERDADLIVLSIQKGKPALAHLPPEITYTVAADAPCPILTFAS